MSLTAAKMTDSLKDQLAQEEKDLKEELAAVSKSKVRASKQKKGKSKD
jgi:hypothetical protein